MLTFNTLYEDYAPDVYRFALWLSGSSFWAEDITSETFIRAWSKRNTIRTETLKAYLFAIARNSYLERRRKQKNPSVLNSSLFDPSPGPEKTIELQADLRQIQEVLMTLSEIDRTTFVLKVQHDLPYDEICRILDLNMSAARVKVHRVRKKIMQNFLEKE